MKVTTGTQRAKRKCHFKLNGDGFRLIPNTQEKLMRKIHEYKIKSLYKGFAPVRDKVINDCKIRNQDIAILVYNKKMILPIESFENFSYSVPVKDKFTSDIHQLLYFEFKEENKQQTNLF